jgi:hypothetical protein
MNRILAFILLFLLGWAVSFFLENIVITLVVCAVAGYFLFRRKKAAPAQAAQAAPKPPAAGGARPYQPQEIVEKFRVLQAGDKAVYMPILYDTLIADQWGRYWSLGIVDLKWHRFDNNQWVRDEPTGPLRMSRRSDAFFNS